MSRPFKISPETPVKKHKASAAVKPQCSEEWLQMANESYKRISARWAGKYSVKRVY